MKDVLIIIQARMGSTRLPGKVIKKLGEKSVIQRVVETCKQVAATVTSIPSAGPWINEIPSSLHIYNGTETDVLARYHDCLSIFRPKHIVRITADCPFISADLIRIAIAAHKAHNAEYTCFDKIISGLDVEVFTREALEKAHKNAESAYDREHVTPWMKNTLQIHRIKKLSLDTPEDLEYLKRIEGQLHG
jgi:spore coat polysaccharide biosynthesis protein SpsF (cytidylyltransferase family)